jgi:hypothetical protein
VAINTETKKASGISSPEAFSYGGHNRDRTCDPLLVRQMLSQLSYAPVINNTSYSLMRTKSEILSYIF